MGLFMRHLNEQDVTLDQLICSCSVSIPRCHCLRYWYIILRTTPGIYSLFCVYLSVTKIVKNTVCEQGSEAFFFMDLCRCIVVCQDILGIQDTVGTDMEQGKITCDNPSVNA